MMAITSSIWRCNVPSSLVIFLLLFHARILSTTYALDGRPQGDGSPSENYGSPDAPSINISPPRELSSNEQHALQKAAMYATIQSSSNYSPDDDTNSVFTSEEEQRAYYYFHAGMAMAASNTMKMTSSSSSSDLDNNEEVDENTSKHDNDNYYSYLEWLLENELESVTRRLNESERNNNNDVTNNGSKDKEQQPDVNVKIEEDTNKEEEGEEVDLISERWVKLLDSLSDNTAAATKDTPYESIHKQYTQEYQHFKCHEYPIHTLFTSNVEAEEIWTELYHYYIKFALSGAEVDVQLKKRKLNRNPDLYINFTTPSLDLSDSENNNTNNSIDLGSNNTKTSNSTITESSKKTSAVVLDQKPRLYAAKNFPKDEVVYSHKHSTYYFSTISQWTSFLRSLPSKKLQCAAIQSTTLSLKIAK